MRASSKTKMLISVVVPSYRRVSLLAACLRALKMQNRPPDEIVVVARKSDQETVKFLGEIRKVTALVVAEVDEPGVVAALNRGIEESVGEIVAFTDDDAQPHVDWLERIEKHFLGNPALGGVGGRDWLYIDGHLVDATARRVGKVQWFGRIVGNHHIGRCP